MNTISIITPVYKPEGYIYDYFGSLKMQTLDKSLFEVILVLNGPKEPYYDMINNYIEQHLKGLNIRIYYQAQSGIVPAANLGLDQAKGEYITFIDCDDYVSEKYLESLYKCRDPKLIVLSDGVSFNDNTKNVYYDNKVHQTYLSLSSNNQTLNVIEARYLTNSAARKLMPISIIGDVRMMNIYGFDSLFMFQILKKNVRFRLSSEDAIYYTRIRKSSVSRRSRNLAFLIQSHFKLGFLIISVYLKAPFSYSFLYFVRTLAACFKAFIIGLTK